MKYLFALPVFGHLANEVVPLLLIENDTPTFQEELINFSIHAVAIRPNVALEIFPLFFYNHFKTSLFLNV